MLFVLDIYFCFRVRGKDVRASLLIPVVFHKGSLHRAERKCSLTEAFL